MERRPARARRASMDYPSHAAGHAGMDKLVPASGGSPGPYGNIHRKPVASCGGSVEIPKPHDDDIWGLFPDPMSSPLSNSHTSPGEGVASGGNRGLINDLFRAVMPPHRTQRSVSVLSDNTPNQPRRSASSVLDSGRPPLPDSPSSDRSTSATLPKLGAAAYGRRSSGFDSSCCTSPSTSPMAQPPVGRMRSSDLSSPQNRRTQLSQLGEIQECTFD